MQTDYVNSVVNVIMEIRERRKVKNEDEGRKKRMKGWTVINTDVLLIPPESGTTERANCNFDELHSKLRQRLGVGNGAGKLRRGPWDLFDREVRYLQRESLSSDITDAEAFSHVSLFLFPLLAKLFEFPFKKRACRVTQLCSKRGAASFLVPCLFRVGRRGFVCVRRVIRNFPGSVYTLYHRFSEL